MRPGGIIVVVALLLAACGEDGVSRAPGNGSTANRGQCVGESVTTAGQASEAAAVVFRDHLSRIVEDFNAAVKARSAKNKPAEQKAYKSLKTGLAEITRARDRFSSAVQTAEQARCEPDEIPNSGPAVCPARAADRYRDAYVSAGKTLKNHLQPILDNFGKLLKSADDARVYRKTNLELVASFERVGSEIDKFVRLKRAADKHLKGC